MCVAVGDDIASANCIAVREGVGLDIKVGVAEGVGGVSVGDDDENAGIQVAVGLGPGDDQTVTAVLPSSEGETNAT